MFASTNTLLQQAQRKHYAVPHFNINNLEILQGVVAAAVKLRSPIILSTSEGAVQYAGMEYLLALAKTAAQTNKIPIALHLDHGRDLNLIRKAIAFGYSSVMIDASQEGFEENIRITRQVVGLAHHHGIAVEAELGTIGGAEDTVSSRHILYTDPEKAKEFVEKTDCNFLAIAIGTSHGAYKFAGKAQSSAQSPARLRLDILKEIRRKVNIPLVLHGASGVPLALVKEAEKYGADLRGVQGVPDNQVKQAIRLGICKINTDTDLRLAFDAAVRKVIARQPKDFDPRHILGPAREAIQKVAEQRIKLCGSGGKG
jgi:fructose-bisphosphate aldolase class II